MKKVLSTVVLAILLLSALGAVGENGFVETIRDGKLENGDILKVEFLGVDTPTISYGEFDVAVFYMEYWSSIEGGVKIASKLFIPVGEAPPEGWPAKVWLHGFGGPGFDFWNWPFQGNDWRGRGYSAGMAFACHGFVCISPWLPGAGPSQPFATYSPFSLERNAQCAYDAFRAFKNLPEYFKEYRDLSKRANIDVRIDFSRQVMSTNCISSPTLIYFASKMEENKDVKISCLIADTFLPSVAYLSHYIVPYSLECNPLVASASFALWAGPIYCLADYENWDMSLFFTEKAIELFNTPVDTPVGKLPLMRSAQLEPLDKSDLAYPLYKAVEEDLGRKPTSIDILNWTFTEEIRKLLYYDTLEDLLQDAFYRKYFANCDPFFEENIDPFKIDIPLLVVGNGDNESKHGMPSPDERWHLIGEPRVETLRSWGWDVRVFHECGVKTTSMIESKGHAWVMRELKKILYPVEITKPREKRLYVMDKEIMPLPAGTLVVGKITVETSTYPEEEVEKVEFYVDDTLKYTDVDEPYDWLWNEFAIGKYDIEVIAYDGQGNKSEDEINVIIFNLGGGK